MKKLAKNRLKKLCDRFWSKIIRDVGKCEICDRTVLEDGTLMRLNAHHLIDRRVLKYRWDIDNGICLCMNCHLWNLNCSAHAMPWAFEQFIREHKPDQYDWWIEHRINLDPVDQDYNIIYNNLVSIYKTLAEAKNDKQYYFDNQKRLRPQRYTSLTEKSICKYYTSSNEISLRETARKFNISHATSIRRILEKYNIPIKSKNLIIQELWNIKKLLKEKRYGVNDSNA